MYSTPYITTAHGNGTQFHANIFYVLCIDLSFNKAVYFFKIWAVFIPEPVLHNWIESLGLVDQSETFVEAANDCFWKIGRKFEF
jgi:hypothetical protein